MERASKSWALRKMENTNSLTEDPAAGDVSSDPAIALDLDHAGGARSPGSDNADSDGDSDEANFAATGCGVAGFHRNVEQGPGQQLVWSAHGHHLAGRAGRDGCDAFITGIFGMAAYSVSKRLKELGIRVALGAQHKEVLQAALGRALKLLAIGSAAGLILGLLATKVLAFIVYQATPRDPLVLAGVVLAMALLGLVATWIPAQRALSVDPLVLLREE